MSHQDSEMHGEIFISPNNKMTAKYKLYAVDDSDTLAEIFIMKPVDNDRSTEISVRVSDENMKDVEIDIMYGGKSDIYTEIQPIGHKNIFAEIEVRPHNRMWGLYEVQQPPILTDIINPVQDSFTRELIPYQSINYGSNNSLVIGETSNDSYKSYVQFGFNNWTSFYVILESKLRLYYSGLIPEGTEIEIFTANEQWQEYGITYLNAPKPESFIVDEYINNRSEMYIEFEFTDIVREWIERTTPNYGFVVALKSNTGEIVSFRARESNRPPELIVEYYDTRVYSVERSQVPIEIFVWRNGESSLNSEITVASVFGDSEIGVEFYVHRPEFPVSRAIETEITMNKPYVLVELTVAHRDESIVPTEIEIRSEEIQIMKDAEISVSKPIVPTEVFVSFLDGVNAEIEISLKPSEDIYTEISTSRENALAEITIKISEESAVLTEISVHEDEEDSIPAVLSVSRENILTEITIKESDDKDAEIYVKHAEDVLSEVTVTVFNDVLTEIDVIRYSQVKTGLTVSKPDVLVSIGVFYWKDNDMPTEIRPRILKVSDISTEIYVRKDAVAYAFIM